MRGRNPSAGNSAHGSWGNTLAGAAAGPVVEAGSARALAALRRVWGPILLRAAALAVALLGLAGIGSVASRAPEAPSPAVARAGLELAALPGGALPLLSVGAADPRLGAALAAASTPGAPPAVLAVAARASSPALSDTPRAPPDAATRPPDIPGAPSPLVPASSAPPDQPGEPAGERRARAPIEPVATPCRESAPASERRPAPSGERVVLNQADTAQLQRLPGVGVKRAEAIVELRQRLGRFRRPSDLLRIKGIGPRTLERMLPHLALDDAAPQRPEEGNHAQR